MGDQQEKEIFSHLAAIFTSFAFRTAHRIVIFLLTDRFSRTLRAGSCRLQHFLAQEWFIHIFRAADFSNLDS